MNRNVFFALLAAALFGASTPFSKRWLGEIHPVLLAGLLYLGSGLGLALVRIVRDGGWRSSRITRSEWPWLLGAIAFGGVLGPVLLLLGLSRLSASSASLLLNLEAVLTAALAWVVFKENTDRRVLLGMFAIVAGSAALVWPGGTAMVYAVTIAPPLDWIGAALVSAACLSWAIDNNLTRQVSASDALFIASTKGLFAGSVNTALALKLGATLPGPFTTMSAMAVGLMGYGASLVLFVLALRGLGAARTGAYFSTAPFLGAVISIAMLGEPTTPMFWVAAALMMTGVGLHLTERHTHEHTHEPLEHAHRHTHDEHHQHAHDDELVLTHGVAHSHPHTHSTITHRHAHYPDIHHRHPH